MSATFVFNDPRLKKSPVRVRVYDRNGTHPDGVLVKDRVLRPLTNAQRKNGEPDLLAEHARRFGRISAPRYSGCNRATDELIAPAPKHDMESGWDHGDVDEDLQLDIWKQMHSYYWAIAIMMSDDGFIAPADEESFAYAMHSYVIAQVYRYDPTRTCDEGDPFDAFCRQQARDFRGKFIEAKYAVKRGGGATHLSLVAGFDGDESSDERRGCISEEAVGALDCARTRDGEAFLRDFNDYFKRNLSKRERIALKELYDGHTQQYVANMLGLKLSTFRRTILGFIQLVVDLELPADAHRYHMSEYGSRKFILK